MAISTAVLLPRHGVGHRSGQTSSAHRAGMIEMDWLFDLRGL